MTEQAEKTLLDMMPGLAERCPEPLWRFMPLSQFLDLAVNGRLWLSSLSLLRRLDPFEGVPEEELLKEYVVRSPRCRFQLDLLKGDASDDRIDAQIHSIYSDFVRRAKTVFASCWHIRAHETFVMWKSYGTLDTPVAIKSSVVRLLESLRIPYFFPQMACGRILYRPGEDGVDYSQYGDFVPLFIKRRHFEEEQELRIVVEESWPQTLTRWKGISLPDGYDPDDRSRSRGTFWEDIIAREESGAPAVAPPPSGIYFNIDLDRMADQILVAPDAPSWVLNTIRSVLELKGLDSTKVARSSLSSRPDFFSLREPIRNLVKDPSRKKEEIGYFGPRKLPFDRGVIASTDYFDEDKWMAEHGLKPPRWGPSASEQDSTEES